MHWFNLIVVAFLYALVGSLIGVSYAILTGADMSSFGNVVVYAGFAGPVVLMVILAFRKLMRDAGYKVPIARAIYHTLLITFATPVLLYGVQLIVAIADAPKVARVFEALKYWSIPLVFITAVLYGVWRIVESNQPRTMNTGTSGRSGGTPPPASGSGSRSVTAPHCDPAVEPPNGDRQSHRVVACFSGRGTLFRSVRHPA